MARRRTVRGSIFLSVSILLVSVLIVFSLVVYDFASGLARERFASALSSLCRSVLTNLDAHVDEMDRLGLTLIYSEVFQNLYGSHLRMPLSPQTIEARIAKLQNAEALIEIAETVLGPSQAAPQINIYDPRGQMIGAGYYSRLIERDVTLEPWYSEVVGRDGRRIILGPHVDQLLEQTSFIVQMKRYVSLLRAFRNPLLSTEGIVEVEQYCDTLFSEVDSLRRSSGPIFVFDADGQLIYPYEPSYDEPFGDLSALRRLAEQAVDGVTPDTLIPGEREPHVFAAAVSRNTGWTLLIGEPSAGVSVAVVTYAFRIALLTVAAIACSLAASYFIARRVTGPLRDLHLEIEALDLESLDKTDHRTSKAVLGEIDELRLAFHDMRLKLNASINEVVSLREHEQAAQLVALQSQLNPHFFHNMLQTLAIMADEGDPEAMQGLIQNLARVLRYVSSTEETTATLGTEIEYVQSYLAAMQVRFAESLIYTIDIPETMEGIVVPRLVLQPFIENCLKYATSGRPPWHIEVRGVSNGSGWLVEVLDDGPGFDAGSLARIREKLTAGKPGDGPPPMSISGMGILNSYVRLRIAYGELTVFEATNRPGGGARIAIGTAQNE